MSKKSFAEAIEVKNPCSESWDEMAGNATVRFCSHCSKNVNNLSQMTRKEALRLVRRSNGRLCVRYEKNPKTNAPVFSARLSQITRQTGVTAGVLGASFALSAGAYAQGEVTPVASTQIEQNSKAGGNDAKISGSVMDSNGAVIPFATVSVINQETFESRVMNASGEGFYAFENLPKGKYTLKIEAGGFEQNEITSLYLSDAGEIRRDAQMAVARVDVTVQVESGDKDIESWVTVGVLISTVSYEKRNGLVAAVMNENLDEVKKLLSNYAKVNVRDRAFDGITPLHAAVESGNFEIMQYLLAYGAKPNARDYLKRTPLMMLDEDAKPEIVQVLIAYGAKNEPSR